MDRFSHHAALVGAIFVLAITWTSPNTAHAIGDSMVAVAGSGSAEGSTDPAGTYPWVVRSRPVHVNRQRLRMAAAEAESQPRMVLSLFDDAEVTIEVLTSDIESGERFTLRGQVADVTGSQATITAHDGAVYGLVQVPGLGMFEIHGDAGGFDRVTQINQSLMPESATGPDQHFFVPGVEAHSHQGGVAGSQNVTVSVLVAYTPAAKDDAGGRQGIEARIRTAMSDTNEALAESDTIVRVTLALADEVSYVESGNLSTDLSRLQNFGNGFMDEVHEWRAEVGADLVALLVSYPDKEFPFCGVAYLMLTPLPSFASQAFSVTRTQCIPNYTFSHELGHNMGCGHAHGDPGAIGSYEYSHGHRFNGDSDLWRTVMAYPPGIRILRFSNPEVFFDGAPTGVHPGQPEPAHNALTIDQNAHIVSHFGGVTCDGPGATIYVPQDHVTIQDAINAAAHCDEIVVGPGTYNESIDFHGWAVHLRSSDGPDVTIIDAGGNGRVVRCDSCGPYTVLEGFTITGGFWSNGHGAGMLNNNSSPTIINCVFTGNTVVAPSPGTSAFGGGMYNLNSNPMVVNCTFHANVASGLVNNRGGGMYNLNSSPTIVNCTFENNVGGFGGGLGSRFGAPTVMNSVFRGNEATSGVLKRGGAVYNEEGDLTVLNSTFEDNFSEGTGGGAIYSIGGTLSVGKSAFIGNVATADGGAVHASSTMSIETSVFEGNSAERGGGLFSNGFSQAISESEFRGNVATNAGGGVFVHFTAFPSIDDTLFCENLPQHIHGPWSGGGNQFLAVCPLKDCLGDLDNNGVIDVLDMLILLEEWGECRDPNDCPADLTGDGSVGVPDLLILLGNWGDCPS